MVPFANSTACQVSDLRWNFNPFVAQCRHWQNEGDNCTYLIMFLWRLNELKYIKCLDECLVHIIWAVAMIVLLTDISEQYLFGRRNNTFGLEHVEKALRVCMQLVVKPVSCLYCPLDLMHYEVRDCLGHHCTHSTRMAPDPGRCSILI